MVLDFATTPFPLLEAYGWPLEAAPFHRAVSLVWSVSDNKALGIFNAAYLGAVEVDVALFELRDYGVNADVDRYRSHMKEYKALLEEKRLLDKRLQRGGLKLRPLPMAHQGSGQELPPPLLCSRGNTSLVPLLSALHPSPPPSLSPWHSVLRLMLKQESLSLTNHGSKHAGESNTHFPNPLSAAAALTVMDLTTSPLNVTVHTPNATPLPGALSPPCSLRLRCPLFPPCLLVPGGCPPVLYMTHS
jgi:hypothetical protein